MADSKTHIFQLRQLSIFFQENFIGLIELIDAKCIGVAQLIWLLGCLTYSQKQAKNAFFVFLGCF